MRIICTVFVLLMGCLRAFSQLTLSPISHSNVATSNPSSARVNAALPLKLPFWDDFSYYTPKKPIQSLWASYATVTINDGMAINPLSLKVATFDGYDASGKPYNVTDNGLVKGFADSLVSQIIDLSTVPPEKQSTVYFSFYYQPQGNGEKPDPGDKLEIFFKSPLGWEQVDIIENTVSDTIFSYEIIPVASRFFHNQFQFKIRNFGRLSGPYDTWNIDYVYLNSDRTSFDNSTPDRAIATPLTSLFKDYRSLPYKHFLKDSITNFTQPIFGLYNFYQGNVQPLNYFSYDSFTQYTGKNSVKTTHPLDSFRRISSVVGLQGSAVPMSKLPLASYFDRKADSVSIELKVGLTSRDNDPTRDYTSNFTPIDFRNNDTIRSIFNLSSYYAYDDGEAEYGAGVNQAGAELAYLFTMKTTASDLLRAVNIYFPDFGDKSSQVFELRIWQEISNTNPIILYKQTVSVQRTNMNKFTTYDLDPSQPLFVQGSFYVGWKQTSSSRMDVGYDANTKSGGNIFYNTAGTWIKNTDLPGSLMIRPIFGKAPDKLITAVNEVKNISVYPNPSKGVFFLPLSASVVTIYDSTGAQVDFQVEEQLTEKKIEIVNRSGLFIIRMLVDGQWIAQRILIN